MIRETGNLPMSSTQQHPWTTRIRLSLDLMNFLIQLRCFSCRLSCTLEHVGTLQKGKTIHPESWCFIPTPCLPAHPSLPLLRNLQPHMYHGEGLSCMSMSKHSQSITWTCQIHLQLPGHPEDLHLDLGCLHLATELICAPLKPTPVKNR